MQQHRGEILEAAIRRSGYHIKRLAARLKISRNTLYNRLKEPNLSYKFIIQVGDIIHYDFSIHFPELKQDASFLTPDEGTSSYIHPSVAELLALEKKYIDLLERYDKLLCILVKMANDNDIPAVKHAINKFLINNEIEQNTTSTTS